MTTPLDRKRAVEEPGADKNQVEEKSPSRDDVLSLAENADSLTEAEIQLEKRRKYNRENAARSRQRAKQTLNALRSRVAECAEKNLSLEHEREILKQGNAHLELENMFLRQYLQERQRSEQGIGTLTSSSTASFYHVNPQERIGNPPIHLDCVQQGTIRIDGVARSSGDRSASSLSIAASGIAPLLHGRPLSSPPQNLLLLNDSARSGLPALLSQLQHPESSNHSSSTLGTHLGLLDQLSSGSASQQVSGTPFRPYLSHSTFLSTTTPNDLLRFLQALKTEVPRTDTRRLPESESGSRETDQAKKPPS